MRNKQPSISINPLFLSTFLAFLFINESQARFSQPYHCTSSCGDIKNISYPFRLSGQPLNCGDSDYTLSCKNNNTILEFKSGKYYVKSINYEQQIIRVVDVNLANGNCSLPTQTVYSSDFVEVRYWGTANLMNAEIGFVKCTRNISDAFYFKIPCMSQNDSITYAVYNSDMTLNQLSCEAPLAVTLAVDDHVANKPSSYEDIQRILQAGFDLGWSVECRDCVRSGSVCDFNRDPGPSYKCRNPYYSDDDNLISIIYSYLAVISDSILGLLIDFVRFICLPLIIFVFLIHKYFTTKKEANTKNKFLQSEQSLMAKRYTFSDILSITNHLADKSGEGRFGAVYKGKLPNGDSVAIKMLENCLISEKDFMKEIAKIIRINHVNVMQLVGFCCEESKRALMYDFMPKGSLDEHLLTKRRGKSVIWEKLDQIALGTAKGIEHLHTLGTDASNCILHLDIKPRNVLLDQDFVPKVADFGMNLFYPKDHEFLANSAENAEVKYTAPELMSGNYAAATCRSDVYSIGMLFLDVVGLSKIKEEGSSEFDCLSWIYDRLRARESFENVTETEAKMAKKLCIVGFWCMQMKPSERPSISKVVEMLRNGTDELQMPPKSFLISDVNVSMEETLSDSSTELLISESMEKSQ